MIKQGNFTQKEKNGVIYYTIPSFDKTNLVKHLFSTRIKGVSKIPFDSLNLGINKEDNMDAVRENFKIVCKVLDVPVDSIAFSNQVHGTDIRIVDSSNTGKGIPPIGNKEGIDGLITNERGITLCTFYADCVPLYFLDPKRKVIALAHAGWKGTASKIGEKTIDKMENIYNCNPKDILVGIGPSIGPCCYEIGENVFKIFNENFTKPQKLFVSKEYNKWNLNLWIANMIILKSRGILENNITVSESCTSCNNDKFYSYRKENGKTGRMASVIQLL